MAKGKSKQGGFYVNGLWWPARMNQTGWRRVVPEGWPPLNRPDLIQACADGLRDSGGVRFGRCEECGTEIEGTRLCLSCSPDGTMFKRREVPKPEPEGDDPLED